jgi:methionyl-tRNA formyltransferase
MSHTGASLWPRALAAIERGGVDRDGTGGRADLRPKITPAEARIDWSRPAAEIDAHIRGLSPFPGAWFEAPGADGPVRIKALLSAIDAGDGAPANRAGRRWPAHRLWRGRGALLIRVQREGKAQQAAGRDAARLPGLPAGTVLA